MYQGDAKRVEAKMEDGDVKAMVKEKGVEDHKDVERASVTKIGAVENDEEIEEQEDGKEVDQEIEEEDDTMEEGSSEDEDEVIGRKHSVKMKG